MHTNETFHHAPMILDSANQPKSAEGQSEDDVLLLPNLIGVFDSVGGRDKGRLVSHLAGQTVEAVWSSVSDDERQRVPDQLETILSMLLRKVDAAIAALEIPVEQRRPATVGVLGTFSTSQGEAFFSVAHVGDSRAYLLSEGQPLRRLTKDHGFFSFAVRHQRLSEEDAFRIEQADLAEQLSPEEREHFQRRREITCALGWSDFSSIPTSSHRLFPGDCVLLCTDGLHDNLTDREIEACLRLSHEGSAHRLVAMALQRSQDERHLRAKKDDISAIVVLHSPVPEP